MSLLTETQSAPDRKLNLPRLKQFFGDRPYMVFSFSGGVFRLEERNGYSDSGFTYSFFEEDQSWTDVFELKILTLDKEFSSDRSSYVGLWVSPEKSGWLVVWEMKSVPDFLSDIFSWFLDVLPEESDLPWYRSAASGYRKTSDVQLILGEPGLDLAAFAGRIGRLHKGPDAEVYTFYPGRLSAAVQMREIFGYAAGARLGSSETIPLIHRDENSIVIIHEVSELASETQRLLAEFLLNRKSKGKLWCFLSSRNLDAMSEAGEFSKELHALLSENQIVVPPVRLFSEQLKSVIEENLIKALIKEHRRKIQVSPEAMDRLLGYDWPGNWEELKTVVEEAFLTCKGNVIQAEDLKIKGPSFAAEETDDLNLRQRTMELEKQLVLKAHALHGGNQVQMARALGISRGSLQYKMEKLGLV